MNPWGDTKAVGAALTVSTTEPRSTVVATTVRVSRYPLAALMAIQLVDQADRLLLSAIFPAVKEEFRLSDSQLGSLSSAIRVAARDTEARDLGGAAAEPLSGKAVIAPGEVARYRAVIDDLPEEEYTERLDEFSASVYDDRACPARP